jgi:hypothetical protein
VILSSQDPVAGAALPAVSPVHNKLKIPTSQTVPALLDIGMTWPVFRSVPDTNSLSELI